MRDFLRKLFNAQGLRRLVSVVVLVAADAAALAAGLVVAGYATGGLGELWSLAPLLAAVWVVVFAANDLYDRAQARRDPGGILGSALVWAGLAVIGSVIYPESGLTAARALVAALVALVVAGGLRLLYEQGIEWIYRSGIGRTPAVVVGGEGERRRILRLLESIPGAYSAAGEVGLSGPPEESGVNLEELRSTLDRTGARVVILAGAERFSDEGLLDLLQSVRLRGVRLRVVPGAISLLRSRPVLSESVGLPLLEVGYPRLDNTQQALKRALDMAGSAAGLLALSPLLAGVALAIKLTSPGPVFFKQKRVGADEKVFLCYKFRSMYRDAEARQAELEAKNEADGAIFKMREDPRVTPVGRFIRRWSIDELPQLINVLVGEMSLVGPRPLPLRDYEQMGELHKRRLAAVPGITGYWQTNGRSDLSFEDMVRLDLYYIENWSLGLDLKIILGTVGAVLRGEGAY